MQPNASRYDIVIVVRLDRSRARSAGVARDVVAAAVVGVCSVDLRVGCGV